MSGTWFERPFEDDAFVGLEDSTALFRSEIEKRKKVPPKQVLQVVFPLLVDYVLPARRRVSCAADVHAALLIGHGRVGDANRDWLLLTRPEPLAELVKDALGMAADAPGPNLRFIQRKKSTTSGDWPFATCPMSLATRIPQAWCSGEEPGTFLSSFGITRNSQGGLVLRLFQLFAPS